MMTALAAEEPSLRSLADGPAGAPSPSRGSTQWDTTLDRLIAELRAASLQDLALARRAAPALLTTADQHGSPIQRVRARTVASGVACLANEFEQALGLLDEARAIASPALDDRALAEIEVAAVQPCARLGRLDDAAEHAQRGVSLFARVGDRVSEGRARCNLGVVHRMRNRKADAVAELDRAASLIDEPVMRAQIRSNTAEVLLELDDHDGAERAFNDAISSFRAAGAARAAAIALGNLADVQGRRGRLQSALACFDQAVALVSDGDSPGDAARLLAEKAEVVAAAGTHREAAHMFREAGLRLEAAGLVVESLRARVGHARAMSILGHATSAERELAECATRAAAIESRRVCALARLARAGVLVGLSRAPEAVSEINAARAELGDSPAVALEGARAALAQSRFSECAELVDGLLAVPERAPPALGIEALLVRAEAMVRQGDADAAIADLERALHAIEQERVSFAREEHRVGWLGRYVDAYYRLIELRCESGAERDADAVFALSERARGRALQERLHGEADVRARIAQAGGVAPESVFEQVATAAAVRAALPPHGALVQCIPIGHALGAVVVRAEGSFLVRFALDRAQCAELVERLNFEASCDLSRLARAQQPVSDRSLLGALRALHEGVWAALEPALDGVRTVTVVPHGPLHGAPLHAAFDGAAFALQSREVSYSPSAGLFAARAPGRSAPSLSSPLLAVGVGDEVAPFAGQEARRLAAENPGAHMLEGAAATLHTVRAALAVHGRAHLAGHAVHVREDPLRSGIRLADGWLTAAHVMALKLPGTRVVLSCCDAGQSTVGPGDEIYGLVRALLVAGARTVVAPIWAVHDGFAPDFMRRLHAALVHSEGASALSQVQRESAASGAHPALWAGFFAIGVAS